MPINWFPGHMNKAKREIGQAMAEVDIVIEVLDARLPDSSENPLVARLRRDKPCIKILNRQDMADPVVTAAWVAHLQRRPGVIALTHDRSQTEQARRLVDLARRLLPPERSAHRSVTAMILGVPNVGKSTLINTMAGRNIARTSNKPAVTKKQQQVQVARDFVLLDTPGFLWPKLSPPECGYRLAISGAIADTAVDYPEMAVFAVEWLAKDYPHALLDRYGLTELPAEPVAVLDRIAARRACLKKGGLVDYQKVSELLVKEIRQGLLGRLSFERPPAEGEVEGEEEPEGE